MRNVIFKCLECFIHCWKKSVAKGVDYAPQRCSVIGSCLNLTERLNGTKTFLKKKMLPNYFRCAHLKELLHDFICPTYCLKLCYSTVWTTHPYCCYYRPVFTPRHNYRVRSERSAALPTRVVDWSLYNPVNHLSVGSAINSCHSCTFQQWTSNSSPSFQNAKFCYQNLTKFQLIPSNSGVDDVKIIVKTITKSTIDIVPIVV